MHRLPISDPKKGTHACKKDDCLYADVRRRQVSLPAHLFFVCLTSPPRTQTWRPSPTLSKALMRASDTAHTAVPFKPQTGASHADVGQQQVSLSVFLFFSFSLLPCCIYSVAIQAPNGDAAKRTGTSWPLLHLWAQSLAKVRDNTNSAAIVFINTTEELDSYLYQTGGQDVIEFVTCALDVPLYRRVIGSSALAQGSEYGDRNAEDHRGVDGDETEDPYALLADVKVMQILSTHVLFPFERRVCHSFNTPTQGAFRSVLSFQTTSVSA